jgi:flagellar assembly protein FliH
MTSSDRRAADGFGSTSERLAAIQAAARQAAGGAHSALAPDHGLGYAQGYAPSRPPLRQSSLTAPRAPALSAWERWEMGTLDGRPASRKAAGGASGTGAERNGLAGLAGRTGEPLAPPAPPAPKIDLAELARIRKDARAAAEAEGRAAGLAEGRKQGHTEGLATGLAAATAHAERLRALTRSFPDALRRAEGELAETVLSLALDVARQVVHRTLVAQPEWVLPLVRDLLNTEPALRGEPRLLLHPEDVALVKNSLGREIEDAGWQVRADDSLARGGCRVQSANGELDGTLPTRWKRVTSALRDGAADGIESA